MSQMKNIQMADDRKMNKKVKNTLLYSLVVLILVLDIITIILHYIEQDDQDSYARNVKDSTNIKTTIKKFFPPQNQFENFNVSSLRQQKYYIKDYYVTSKLIQQKMKNLELYDFLGLQDSFQLKTLSEIVFQPEKISQNYVQAQILKQALSEKQIIQIFRDMIDEKQDYRILDIKKQLNENQAINFYTKLYNDPQNNQYLQVEYFRYNELYKIGEFSLQLPICVVLVGKNNMETIQSTYQSVYQQNYTNFKLIHIDDNSQDQTINNALQYLQRKKEFKNFVTIISQKYQRNKLFNFDFAIKNHCQINDIILQMKENQFLVGQQVFQLINSIYQSKQKEEVWTISAESIKYIKNQSSTSPKSFSKQHGRNSQIQASLRVPMLRTYLRKIYDKLDQKQFIDQLMVKQGQFFTTGYQFFIYRRILEMSSTQHAIVLEQNLLFYTYIIPKIDLIEYSYAWLSSQIIQPYKPLNNLLEHPSRKNKVISEQVKKRYELSKQKIKQKRMKLKSQINQLYKKSLTDNIKERDFDYLNFIESRNIFRQDNMNKQLGKVKGLIINPLDFDRNQQSFSFEQYGLDRDIQISTNYDYVNLQNHLNFSDVEKKIFQQVSYEVLAFKYDKQLEEKKQNLQYKHFKTELEIKTFLKQSRYFTHMQDYVKDEQYFIGSMLSLPQISQQTKQLQYYFMNKKYNIQNNFQQNPICILSAGYNIYSQGRYHKLFDSLQGMNYSNYKLLWIDDNSPDNSAYNLYKYLKGKNMKIKNRVQIIHNLQHLGIMANIHIYIKKYCGADDIVIICDADDSIIGIQTFQILSSIFKNPNYWYVHTRFLMKVDKKRKNLFVVGRSSKKLDFPIKQYRTKINVWTTSHMRIFRKKVMDKVPLQHFIEYKYSKEQQKAWPVYHTSSADRFQVYSNLQLCGDKRIFFIKDVLYKYDTSMPEACYRHKEMYEQFKSKMKRKLKPLTSLQSEAEFYQKQKLSPQILTSLKKYFQLYKQCQNK